MESERRYVIAGVEGEKEGKDSKMGLEVERSGSEGNVVIMRRTSSKVRPWRTTQDIPRACLDVLVAGVGYLLYVCFLFPFLFLSFLLFCDFRFKILKLMTMMTMMTLADIYIDRFGYSMLAVMTANIGYFISILGGTFLGNLIAGRFFA